MDDKTFIAKYVADESERINQSLKELITKGEAPSEAEKDALFADMEATLKKLTSALEFLTINIDKDEEEEVPVA